MLAATESIAWTPIIVSAVAILSGACGWLIVTVIKMTSALAVVESRLTTHVDACDGRSGVPQWLTQQMTEMREELHGLRSDVTQLMIRMESMRGSAHQPGRS